MFPFINNPTAYYKRDSEIIDIGAYKALIGGDEENRTPVRKSRLSTFYERSH